MKRDWEDIAPDTLDLSLSNEWFGMWVPEWIRTPVSAYDLLQAQEKYYQRCLFGATRCRF